MAKENNFFFRRKAVSFSDIQQIKIAHQAPMGKARDNTEVLVLDKCGNKYRNLIWRSSVEDFKLFIAQRIPSNIAIIDHVSKS